MEEFPGIPDEGLRLCAISATDLILETRWFTLLVHKEDWKLPKHPALELYSLTLAELQEVLTLSILQVQDYQDIPAKIRNGLQKLEKSMEKIVQGPTKRQITAFVKSAQSLKKELYEVTELGSK